MAFPSQPGTVVVGAPGAPGVPGTLIVVASSLVASSFVPLLAFVRAPCGLVGNLPPSCCIIGSLPQVRLGLREHLRVASFQRRLKCQGVCPMEVG